MLMYSSHSLSSTDWIDLPQPQPQKIKIGSFLFLFLRALHLDTDTASYIRRSIVHCTRCDGVDVTSVEWAWEASSQLTIDQEVHQDARASLYFGRQAWCWRTFWDGISVASKKWQIKTYSSISSCMQPWCRPAAVSSLLVGLWGR